MIREEKCSNSRNSTTNKFSSAAEELQYLKNKHKLANSKLSQHQTAATNE
jgi:hypothetical protein